MRELFKFHDQSSAPAESKQLLEKVKASSGMIPGLYAVLAESPEALKAYVELGKIFSQSSLSDEEKINFQKSIDAVKELFDAAKKIDKNLK